MLVVNSKIWIILWYIDKKEMVYFLIEECLFFVFYFEFLESFIDSFRNIDR